MAHCRLRFAKGMTNGKNAWAVPCEGLGDICWQFDEIFFMKSLEKADMIFGELQKLISDKYSMSDELLAVFDYQRKILKRTGQGGRITIVSDYDFYSYCKRIYEGEFAPLEKRRTVITAEDKNPCDSLFDYACSVVWYGRNQAPALYSSDFYSPEIQHEGM